MLHCPEVYLVNVFWRKFDRTDFDSFVTSLFHLATGRGEVQQGGVTVHVENTPAAPVA
jgi:hypothetical protein